VDGPHLSGNVWSTHTTLAVASSSSSTDMMYWYFTLGIAVEQPWNLTRRDLYPPLALSQAVVVWDYDDPRSARLVSAGQPTLSPMMAVTAPCKFCTLGHRYVITAPVLASGWALLGEPAKLTPVSVQRRWRLADTGSNLHVEVAGASGESVAISAWRGGVVSSKSVLIGPSGTGSVVF